MWVSNSENNKTRESRGTPNICEKDDPSIPGQIFQSKIQHMLKKSTQCSLFELEKSIFSLTYLVFCMGLKERSYKADMPSSFDVKK